MRIGIDTREGRNAMSYGVLLAGSESYLVIIIIVILILAIVAYMSKQNRENTESRFHDVSGFGGIQNSGDPFDLFGVGGAFAGQQIKVDSEVIIGRDPKRCTLVFPEKAPGVSGQHCRLRSVNSGVEITDLGSTYGTFKSSGEKIPPNLPVVLKLGESFYLADKQNAFIVKK